MDGDNRNRPVDGNLDGSANPSMTFDVYRDPLSSLAPGPLGSCWQTGLTDTTVTDNDDPLPGEGRFYVVAGQDAATGSLGFNSAGDERMPASACP